MIELLHSLDIGVTILCGEVGIDTAHGLEIGVAEDMHSGQFVPVKMIGE